MNNRPLKHEVVYRVAIKLAWRIVPRRTSLVTAILSVPVQDCNSDSCMPPLVPIASSSPELCEFKYNARDFPRLTAKSTFSLIKVYYQRYYTCCNKRPIHGTNKSLHKIFKSNSIQSQFKWVQCIGRNMWDTNTKPAAPNFKLARTDAVQLKIQAGGTQMSDIYKTMFKMNKGKRKTWTKAPVSHSLQCWDIQQNVFSLVIPN